jgi:hypothetical protein
MASADEWVKGFLARAERGLELDRVVEEPSGLDADGILRVLADDRLGARVIDAMSDLMHPTDSMYYDAIFGAFRGQVAIRNWLVPTMREISFVEFVPTAPTESFAHERGASSIDEWQMWADLGEEKVPLPRGVSTRHYADGWVTWNADVYDTAPMRQPPGAEAAALPPPPQPSWASEPMVAPPVSEELRAWLELPAAERGPLDHADIHAIMLSPELGLDPDVVGALWHPTESRLVEPTGEHVGADAIRTHLGRRRAERMAVTLEQIGPALFNGDCTAFEWLARRPGDARAIRGTSVCRYRDGMIVHAADYYDTARS